MDAADADLERRLGGVGRRGRHGSGCGLPIAQAQVGSYGAGSSRADSRRASSSRSDSHDEIGRGEPVGRDRAHERHARHAGGARRRDAHRRILDHDAAGGRQAEALGRDLEHLRVGLAARDVATRSRCRDEATRATETLECQLDVLRRPGRADREHGSPRRRARRSARPRRPSPGSRRGSGRDRWPPCARRAPRGRRRRGRRPRSAR